MAQTVFAYAALALTAMSAVAPAEARSDERKQTETEIVRSSGMADSPTKGEAKRVKGEVPQGIPEAILKEIAGSAGVGRDQIAIERAQSVVWSDGSLGCPEPGMAYTQALVKGYWVVVEAAGKKYDFRVGSGGQLPVVPPGTGQATITVCRKLTPDATVRCHEQLKSINRTTLSSPERG